VSDESLRRGKA